MKGRPMGLKLAVVDQSIKDLGGHHFEYAVRVTTAARAAGLEPVLGVNATAQIDKHADMTVVPVFRRTFWQNSQRNPELRRIARLVGSLRRTLETFYTRVLTRFRYSSFGLAALRAREISLPYDETFRLVSGALTWRRSNPEALTIAWGVGLFARKLIRVGRLPRKIVRRASQMRRIGRILGLVRRLIRFGLRMIVRLAAVALFVLFSPLIAILLVGSAVARWVRPDETQVFKSDLARFIKKARLNDGDVVFVPTLGEAELLAILALCRRSAKARSLRWRLMFRRDIYSGWPSGYTQQNSGVALRRFRLTLARAARFTPQIDLRFYTDTDPLTVQHNLARLVRFETAPIPVDTSLAELPPPSQAGPRVTFGYLGDARDEKGYPLIAPAIDLLRRQASNEPDCHFLLQSNFNTPGGESGSMRSYLELQAMPTAWRDLIFGPFDSQAYRSWLAKMDAVIIPYDPTNYAARSSGVYAEALTAGRPAIVTGASWMAGLAEPFRQTYLQQQERIFVSARQLQTIHVFNSHRGDNTAGKLEPILIERQVDYLHMTLSGLAIQNDEFVNITFVFSKETDEIGRRTETLGLCRETLRLLIPVPNGATEVDIELANVSPGIAAIAKTITVSALRSPRPVPLGFGVAICQHSAQGLADALDDVRQNRAAYIRMAATMRKVWGEACSPATLVAQIANGKPFEIDWNAAADDSVKSYLAGHEGSSAKIEYARASK